MRKRVQVSCMGLKSLATVFQRDFHGAEEHGGEKDEDVSAIHGKRFLPGGPFPGRAVNSTAAPDIFLPIAGGNDTVKYSFDMVGISRTHDRGGNVELNWELCRIFYQVARCRNFSRAAAMLFTSQPAVSRFDGGAGAGTRVVGCSYATGAGWSSRPRGGFFTRMWKRAASSSGRGREELAQAVGLQSGEHSHRGERDGAAGLGAVAAGTFSRALPGSEAAYVRRHVV